MANRISVIVDASVDKAVSGFKGFKQSIGDADGAVNKFKSGAGAAFDQVKAHAGQLALAGGAALVAFGVKAVAAFQETALSAGEFADATGLSTEVASRWTAVADDIGISSESMQKSFGKLAQSIGKNNPLLEQYGITVRKGADGQDDMNATMLHAVDVIRGIQDPTKKAAVAQAALGKGWMEMAELIQMGSTQLTDSMAEVSDAQVVDADEVEKARKLRESLDELQDSVRDVALVLGEDLVPMVTVAADGLVTLIGPMSALNQWSKDVTLGLLDLIGVIDKLPGDTDNAGAGVGRMATSLDEASGAGHMHLEMQEGLKAGIEDTAAATEEAGLKNESFADGVQDLVDHLSDAADAFADNALASLDWMGEIQGSMSAAADAIGTFSDDSLKSIDAFQQELSDDVEGLHNWQDDIVAIAAATSPEFAGFLAEMGLAGADLVDKLANNKDELATTFEQWKVAAAVVGRDVPAEIAKADPETQRIIERLGKNVIDTLGVSVTPTRAASRAVGQAIVDGMRAGITSGAREVGAAAAKVVTDSLTAARAAGDMHSPSRLFADEVGHPIVAGIEEGILEDADKIGKALERSIESAQKDALNAVDDLVDAAKARFDDAWDAPDAARSIERLNERISDATTDVADAQTKANEAAAEFGYNSPEYVDAAEALSDAERSLEDAHYALLKASEGMLEWGPQGEAQFRALADAAGLTGAEVTALIVAYRELQQAAVDAAAATDAIASEASAAQETRARFGQAAAAGLVPQDWIDHIAQFADQPGFTVDLMRAFLATLPSFAGGGLVRGSLGSPQLVVAHAGEYITPHNQIAGGWAGMGSAPAAANVSVVVEGNIYGDKHLRTQLNSWARNVQRELSGAQ